MIWGQAVANCSQGPTPQFVWPDLEYGQAGLTWKQSTFYTPVQTVTATATYCIANSNGHSPPSNAGVNKATAVPSLSLHAFTLHC